MSDERAYGNVFNVGATTEISIFDLAERIVEMTGSQSDIALIPYEKAYAEGFEDMYRRVPDIAKVQRLTGWAPARTLEDIIQDVIDQQRGAPAPVTLQARAGSTVGQPAG
jgi:UDP-glucose 4-epimerase